MGKLAKRHAKIAKKGLSALVKNPPIVRDLTESLAPGLGAFAASKVLQRVMMMLIAKRFPKLTKHAGVLSSLATLVAAWYVAGRWKRLARYQVPILIGSGIAFVQSATRAYLPAKATWLLSDPDPADYVRRLHANATPVLPEIDDGTDLLEDGGMEGYIEVTDADEGGSGQASGPTEMDEALGDLDPDDLGSLAGGEELETDNVFSTN